MHIALLFIQLSLPEIRQLTKEFPQFLFLMYNDSNRRSIGQEQWSQVEVLFTSKLTPEELSRAKNLRWIHTPAESLRRLPLSEIKKRENILLTYTREDNSLQIGEFVIGSVLSFAKNLYDWKSANRFPSIIWDAKWRQTMISLEGKKFLQIGMGLAGTETARKAEQMGMKVTSIDKERSFHPYCVKNLSILDLHAELIDADVVSVNFMNKSENKHWFGPEELKLMKKEAILIILGPTSLFDKLSDEDLKHFAKLRGCLIDAPYDLPTPANSKIWNVPNLIVTPDVSSRPKSTDSEAFRLFRNNLRQYIRDNFLEMKYLVDTSLILTEEETFF